MRTFPRRLWRLIPALVACAPSWLSAAETPAASQTPPEPVFLKPGEMVQPFDATGIDGVARRVDFPKNQTTVLIFFSSGCPHCRRMIPEWNKWFAMRPSKLAVIGVLLDREPPGFFEMVPVSFHVLRSPGPSLLEQYKVAKVPITLRVAPGGRVEDIGVGEIDGIRLGQLFRP